MAKSLYICYFGVHEPLVQTQVLPYLREIRKGQEGKSEKGGKFAVEVSLLTFEPDTSLDADAIRNELAAEGIDWHWLKYHKRFSVLATAWDIFQGARFVRRFIARENPDILHGRVHVPTLMGALGRKFSRRKPKLLFDIRGFFPEEYVDAGVWPENGVIYSAAKRVERWLLKVCDGFVVLTEKAREVLFPESKDTGYDGLGRPVEVIPCCVDLEKRFSPADGSERNRTRIELANGDRFTIVHVGALGGLYLQNEIADFLAAAKQSDPNIFSIFLTQSKPELIIPLLKERGFTDSDFIVRKVSAAEVPRYLEASDVGLSFVKASFATLSRSPTKIPEYLACGLPIIANAGVGDVDKLIEENGIGALVEDFSSKDYLSSFEFVSKLNGVNKHCREIAQREFDLAAVGGARYRRLYGRMLRSGSESR